MRRDACACRQIVIDEVPLGRMGRAAEVASMIGFLASEQARGIPGAISDVVGGWGKCM